MMVFLQPQVFDLHHCFCQEVNPMFFDVLLGEEIGNSVIRSCVSEGFNIGLLPTGHIILDLQHPFGIEGRIEPSYVRQDCAEKFESVDRGIAVVKVFVDITVRHRDADRFAYIWKVFLKPRYHSVLVFNGVRPKDGSHAGNPFASSILTIARRKDGFPIEMVSHGGNDGDVRKQMQGC